MKPCAMRLRRDISADPGDKLMYTVDPVTLLHAVVHNASLQLLEDIRQCHLRVDDLSTPVWEACHTTPSVTLDTSVICQNEVNGDVGHQDVFSSCYCKLLEFEYAFKEALYTEEATRNSEYAAKGVLITIPIDEDHDDCTSVTNMLSYLSKVRLLNHFLSFCPQPSLITHDEAEDGFKDMLHRMGCPHVLSDTAECIGRYGFKKGETMSLLGFLANSAVEDD